LARCLRSLARLDPAPPAVVLVDGNDEAVAIPEDAPSSLHVVREPNQGPAHARNTGLRSALDIGADVVVFADDDVVVSPDWFGRHMLLHDEHPEAGAVGGGVTNPYPESLVAEYTHKVVFADQRPDPGPTRMLPTLNFSMKAACAADVGEFDETFPLPGGEDVDLCWRILKAGWTLHYQPDLVVEHHYATSWRRFARQQRNYGVGFAQSRSRWRDLPGAEFLDLPLWQAVGGYVPHLAREALRTARIGGPKFVAPSLVGEFVYRSAALAQRRRIRLAHESGT
jgi:GT2 family glycosyltransferase